MPNPQQIFWDDWLLMGFQAATLIALVVYVWKTWEMASATRDAASASSRAIEEARQARAEALAPRVLVYLNQSELTNAQVVIQNAGAGTATDLQITFEPPLQSSHGWEVNRYFKTAKPILPPGARIEHVFDTWASYLNSELPRTYKVGIRCVGAETGVRYETEQTLDVTALEHLLGLEGC
jgi:hypothetical protein